MPERCLQHGMELWKERLPAQSAVLLSEQTVFFLSQQSSIAVASANF
jgi:hypothetical protein